MVANQAMEFFLNLKDACAYFLLFVVLVISWNFRKYWFSIWGTPVKTKLRLLRLPSLAFKECMLSMDLNEM
ncbi:hypothetical protein CAEBREN_19240 [Caenorhabditis brenneri]|uniref:Uncharacterized protein n=1 Tax=Caenorhabditis brenneri TaxID=135651 RepID=G0NVN1_CAEBE|nr:hypothetical protein CAEBREN_19240 [Caenorhabditis brenneri]